MPTKTIKDFRAHIEYDGVALLETFVCGQCGGFYAIAERYARKKREEGGYWTCPYCKCLWGYSKERSDLEEAKAKAKQAEAKAIRMKDERDTAERRRRGQKAAKTRVMNRIKAGECPCCGMTFPDLHQHMTEAHPQYAEPKERL